MPGTESILRHASNVTVYMCLARTASVLIAMNLELTAIFFRLHSFRKQETIIFGAGIHFALDWRMPYMCLYAVPASSNFLNTSLIPASSNTSPA